MNRFLRIFFAAWIGFFALAQSVVGQAEEHLGPLARFAILGQDGAWEGRVEGGWYNLFNQSEPGAVQYYRLDLGKVTSGERVVKLNTALVGTGSDTVYSGILLDWISETEYFGFTIGSDGSITVIQRTAEGFNFQAAEEARARLDGSDVLELRETPTTAQLLANGEEVFSIEYAQGFSPSYGIIAVGTGRFAYTGFNVVDTAGQTPFPSPGGGGGGDDPQFPQPGGGGGTTPDNGGGPPPVPGGGGNPPPPVPPVNGGDQPTPQQLYFGKVLMGTTMGVFFHEFAHALIGETGLPATGPEEDTADGFSALLMAAMTEEGDVASEAEREFLEGMSEYAALFWYYSGKMSENGTPVANAWQDEHAPDLNRFRNMFCLIYGSNPNRYEDVAGKVGFTDRTKSRCRTDFDKRSSAWEKILASVSRNLGPDFPGDQPADAPGAQISLVMQPSQLPEGQAVKQLLETDDALRQILDLLGKVFVFPRELKVEFRDCQELNAWYDPQAGAITMCYSLIQYTTQLVLQSEQNSGGGGVSPGPNQVPPPAQPQTGQAQYLVGTWQAEFQANGQTYQARVAYTADGNFQSVSDTPYGQSQVTGRWTATVASDGNSIRLNVTPINWSPEQFCDNNGNCQPNQQQAYSADLQVVDQNTVQVQGVSWKRQ